MTRRAWTRLLPIFGLLLAAGLVSAGAGSAGSEGVRLYVGSAVCGECHDQQYETFTTYAKKAHSYKSVLTMRRGLTDEEYRNCLECHATGYGQPGGFTSVEETPHLQDAGCEVCHGPGSLHVETNDTAHIRSKLTLEDCQRCHNEDRVQSFNFKPLLFGGAH